MIQERNKRFEGPIEAFKSAATTLFPGQPEKQEGLLKALEDSENADAILACTDSMMHTPPEARAMWMIYAYRVGLKTLLDNVGLEPGEHVSFVNNLAGVKVFVLHSPQDK